MSKSSREAAAKPFVNNNFTTLVSRDFFSMVCGDIIGSGVARWVFINALDQTTVVKIEPGSGSFQNVGEWQMWQEWKDKPFGKWLAPCIGISPCGSTLIQKRTSKVPPSFKWPKRVPQLLTDRKYANFGLLGRRLVAHDYGLMYKCITGLKASKLERAEWWGDEPADLNRWKRIEPDGSQ